MKCLLSPFYLQFPTGQSLLHGNQHATLLGCAIQLFRWPLKILDTTCSTVRFHSSVKAMIGVRNSELQPVNLTAFQQPQMATVYFSQATDSRAWEICMLRRSEKGHRSVSDTFMVLNTNSLKLETSNVLVWCCCITHNHQSSVFQNKNTFLPPSQVYRWAVN